MSRQLPNFFPGGLFPVRVELDLEDRRYRDAFLWNSEDSDVLLRDFVNEAVVEAGLPVGYFTTFWQTVQSQVSEFREILSYLREQAREAEESNAPVFGVVDGESLFLIRLDVRVNNLVLQDQFYWDVNDPDADPDGFARQLCKDMNVTEPEMAPSVSIALREQLAEIARQAAGTRESRLGKKGRRAERLSMDVSAAPYPRISKGVSLLTLLERTGGQEGLSVVRPPHLWETFSPSVEILNQEEVEALEQKEQRKARLKRRAEEREDMF